MSWCERCSSIHVTSKTPQTVQANSPLFDIELERLEPPADGGTAGTLPSRSLLLHEDLDTRLAEAADAFCACVRTAQTRETSTCAAVDLNVLRIVGGRRVGQPLRADMVVVVALVRLDRWERFGDVLDVRRWRQSLLKWRCLVAVLLQLCLVHQGRQRASWQGCLRNGGLWHLDVAC